MYKASKRACDLFFATVALVLLSPFFVLAALAILFDSGRPVFFKQTRVGKDGVLFEMLKYRSMIKGAEQSGPRVTAPRDPRITRIGLILRKTKIDELPQLVNVLKGEMSLVGPRPEVPRLASRYSAEQKKIFQVKPGLTSPGTLYYYRFQAHDHPEGVDLEDYYLQKQLPEKLAYDFAYLNRPAIGKDLLLLLKTLWVIVTTPFVRPQAVESKGNIMPD